MSESKAVLLYHLRAGHPRKVIWFKWRDGVGVGEGGDGVFTVPSNIYMLYHNS